MDKEVHGRARADGWAELASRRNKKERDLTDPFIHKSTLLSTTRSKLLSVRLCESHTGSRGRMLQPAGRGIHAFS